MATVIVSFTTKVQEFPGVVEAGKFSVSISGVGTETSMGEAVTFNDVQPGDYSAQVIRLDKDGNILGDVVSKSFNIPKASTTKVDVPDVVDVVIS